LAAALAAFFNVPEQFRVAGFQVFHDFPVVALDLADVDLLDVNQAEQLLHRPGHVAAAFVAGAAALGDTPILDQNCCWLSPSLRRISRASMVSVASLSVAVL
jgi:hypothetical protein